MDDAIVTEAQQVSNLYIATKYVTMINDAKIACTTV